MKKIVWLLTIVAATLPVCAKATPIKFTYFGQGVRGNAGGSVIFDSALFDGSSFQQVTLSHASAFSFSFSGIQSVQFGYGDIFPNAGISFDSTGLVPTVVSVSTTLAQSGLHQLSFSGRNFAYVDSDQVFGNWSSVALSVPEPGSLILLSTGLIGFFVRTSSLRRRFGRP